MNSKSKSDQFRSLLRIFSVISAGFAGCNHVKDKQLNGVKSTPPPLKVAQLTNSPYYSQSSSDSELEQEIIFGKDIEPVETKETQTLHSSGWRTLTKNKTKWHQKPPSVKMLGYYKDGLYYVIFISRESKGEQIKVTHIIAKQLSKTNSSDYFLPEK